MRSTDSAPTPKLSECPAGADSKTVARGVLDVQLRKTVEADAPTVASVAWWTRYAFCVKNLLDVLRQLDHVQVIADSGYIEVDFDLALAITACLKVNRLRLAAP